MSAIDPKIDAALDSVLKASGSALKNYTMQLTLDRMREAMRKVMSDSYIAGAEDLEAAARRLALELECLLLDCKDLPTVSKWFESAHEALTQWHALDRQPHVSPLGMP